MNDHEAQRIAAAMHQLRPDWPAASLLTLIRKSLIDRPRRDVTVALAWVACESASHTPARVLESGPWWPAAGFEGTTARRYHDATEVCQICNYPPEACARLWNGDHEFLTVDEWNRQRGNLPSAERIAELRSQVTTTTPPETKTLDDLAEANPELAANVAAVRAAIPKDAPMREPEPPTTSPPPAAIPEQHLTRGTA